MSDDQIFATLRRARRIWAIASVHGEADKLAALHKQIEPRFQPGDRVVYLGNVLGRGAAVRETVDQALRFRRALMARPGMFACDVAYLRGGQEEMWQKLLQLQMAPNPGEVLQWMLDQGVGATIMAYGGDIRDALYAARQGPMAITRWTNALRAAVHDAAGHGAFYAALRRAAFTDRKEEEGAILFVNAGLDPTRPLSAQTDSFWWGLAEFSKIAAPYGGFRMIVRGFDPQHRGVIAGEFTTGIDAGCGFGGPLVAACFDREGNIIETIEA
jgi:serine/threonine protein phosphatase 1